MNTHHPLVIAGAGPGGLTLARILHVNGLDAVVLEADAAREARTQGGMLDIHEESGQPALRDAGLLEAFRARTLPGGEAARVLDQHAAVLFEEPDDGQGGRPEIHRGPLRDLLLDALPAGMVRWGARVATARTLPGSRHELTLVDGSTVTADLLVGADGAWSRVRRLVTDAAPAHTGIVAVEADLPDADRIHPRAAAIAGGGSLFALGDNRGILAHREPGANLHLYASLRAPEDTLAGIDFGDPTEARRSVLRWFEGWAPDLRALIADVPGALVPRPIVALPRGLRWDPVPGVTLLGDAAHVMPPFAGEGANAALTDAAELARCILAHPGAPDTAIAAYEGPMFARAADAAEQSFDGLDLLFSRDAAAALAAQFAAFADASR